MSFEKTLARLSHALYPEREFVRMTALALSPLGFNAENTIACAGLCRDEITQPLIGYIKEEWGESFNLSSLAGMFFAGKTGLKAAMHHAPNMDGRERYVFYAMPHIAIGQDGELGACTRRGRHEVSTACGALAAFRGELLSGRVAPGVDNDDVEQSLLKLRLLRELPYGQVPDLLDLTEVARRAVHSDLASAIRSVVHSGRSDYALITGIQVHGPEGNLVSCASFTAVVDGEERELSLYF